MKIGVIGSGVVGQTLGTGLIKYGHQVTIGTRNATSLSEWSKANPAGHVASVPETAKSAEVIVLAVNGKAALAALELAGDQNLAGKTIIDATNPIADAPPVNGVVKFFTTLDLSLLEQLQAKFKAAHLVKAFNSVGAALMINPGFKGGKPTMFICGNDDAAKKTVTGILDQFGWETADMGKAESARAIEPLCMLWLIPGFSKNQWGHAFKLLTA